MTELFASGGDLRVEIGEYAEFCVVVPVCTTTEKEFCKLRDVVAEKRDFLCMRNVS